MRKLMGLALLWLVAGCASSWPPATLPSLEELTEGWWVPAESQAVKMAGEMTLFLKDTQYSAEHSLLISESGRFRLDMFGPFEKRVFTIVCDGVNLAAIYYDENSAWVGRATPANLARFMGMDLNPVHIFQVLSARAPFWLSREEVMEYGRLLASSNRGEFLLLLEEERRARQSITFAFLDMRVIEATLLEENDRRVDISYRYRQDAALPQRIELNDSDNQGVNMYNDIALWVDFNENDFILPVLPAGMRVNYLDAY